MRRTKIQADIGRFPEPVRLLLKDAPLYDSSCSDLARVYYADREGGLFLKAAPAGSLRTEAQMTAYFHSLGLSAEVLYYASAEGEDYLLTRRIPGEDCTDPMVLARPERLCDTTALLLRQLHETDPAGCPVPDRNESYAAAVRRGLEREKYEPELFAGIWEFASCEEARRTAREGLASLEGGVLLHGDYCLPNILLQDWRFTGFIDLGNGGVGDRHIDLLWGIWTLKFNLGTDRLTDRFLDAYGRDRVDPEKLRLVAAMEMVGL